MKQGGEAATLPDTYTNAAGFVGTTQNAAGFVGTTKNTGGIRRPQRARAIFAPREVEKGLADVSPCNAER